MHNCVQQSARKLDKEVVLGFSRYHLFFFQHSCKLTGTQQYLKKFVLSKTTVQRGSQHCQSVLSLVEIFAKKGGGIQEENQVVST